MKELRQKVNSKLSEHVVDMTSVKFDF